MQRVKISREKKSGRRRKNRNAITGVKGKEEKQELWKEIKETQRVQIEKRKTGRRRMRGDPGQRQKRKADEWKTKQNEQEGI